MILESYQVQNFVSNMNSQKRQKQQQKVLSHHILPTGSTIIGVCVTVITFLKATNFHLKTYADYLLGIDTIVFTFSCFLSYISMRQENNRTSELIADNLFLVGMSIMVLVGLLILYLD